jgi:hypothetical protein
LHQKTCYPVSISGMGIGVAVGSLVNAALTFAGLVICMPCMASDFAGAFGLMAYLKRGGKGKVKLTRGQAFALGGLTGLLGSFLFMVLLFLTFLAFGNLADMVSGNELFGNSISGIVTIPGWLVLFIGFFIIFLKTVVGAVSAAALSSLESG